MPRSLGTELGEWRGGVNPTPVGSASPYTSSADRSLVPTSEMSSSHRLSDLPQVTQLSSGKAWLEPSRR